MLGLRATQVNLRRRITLAWVNSRYCAPKIWIFSPLFLLALLAAQELEDIDEDEVIALSLL